MKEKTTFETLVESIRSAHRELSAHAGRAVNISLTLRNWLIGFYIEEYELKGDDRAEYGQGLFRALAKELKGVSNCNQRQLYRYHRFYQVYPGIVGTLSPQFRSITNLKEIPIVGTSSPKLEGVGSKINTYNISDRLSYSHFEKLVEIDDPTQRAFYELECIRGN